MNYNGTFSQVLALTVDREMALQSAIGTQIFKRYGIDGDIDLVNNTHRMNVSDFIKEKGDEACQTIQV